MRSCLRKSADLSILRTPLRRVVGRARTLLLKLASSLRKSTLATFLKNTFTILDLASLSSFGLIKSGLSRRLCTAVKKKVMSAVKALTSGFKKRIMAKLLKVAQKAAKIVVKEFHKRMMVSCLVPNTVTDEFDNTSQKGVKKTWKKIDTVCRVMGVKYSGGRKLVEAIYSLAQQAFSHYVVTGIKVSPALIPWQYNNLFCDALLKPTFDPNLDLSSVACNCYESSFCKKEQLDCHRKNCPCRYMYKSSAASDGLVYDPEYTYQMGPIPESGVVDADVPGQRMYNILQRDKPIVFNIMQLKKEGEDSGLPECEFTFKTDLLAKMRPKSGLSAKEKQDLKQCAGDPFKLGNDDKARKRFARLQKRCLDEIVFKQSGPSGLYENIDCENKNGFIKKVVQGRITYAAKNAKCRTTFLMYETLVRVVWGLYTAGLSSNFDKCYDQHATRDEELGEGAEKELKVDLSPKGRVAIKKVIKDLTRKTLDKAAGPPGSKSPKVTAARRTQRVPKVVMDKAADEKAINKIDLSPKGITVIKAAIKTAADKELSRVGTRKKKGFLERQARAEKPRQTTRKQKLAYSLPNKIASDKEIFHIGYHAGCKSKKPKWFTAAGKATIRSEIQLAWKQATGLPSKRTTSRKVAVKQAVRVPKVAVKQAVRVPLTKPSNPSVVVDKDRIQEWKDKLPRPGRPDHSANACQVPWFLGGQCMRDDGNCVPELIEEFTDRPESLALHDSFNVMSGKTGGTPGHIGLFAVVTKQAFMTIKAIPKALCVGPPFMNFGFLKDPDRKKWSDAENFCCAEGKGVAFALPGTPMAIRTATWQKGWASKRIPSVVKGLCQKVGGCTSATKRYAVWAQTCDALTGQYNRGCHVRGFFANQPFAAINPMADAFKQRMEADKRAGKKPRTEDVLAARTGQGYFPKPLVMMKTLFKLLKQKKKKQFFALLFGLIPKVVATVTGTPLQGLACACNEKGGQMANLDFGITVSARYCKGDANNCDKHDAMFMSSLDPKAKIYTLKNHLRKPLQGPVQFKIRTVRLSDSSGYRPSIVRKKTECVFSAIGSSKLCRCSPGPNARATVPEHPGVFTKTMPTTCGCKGGLFEKSMKVSLDYASEEPGVKQRCEQLFIWADVMLRSMWNLDTTAMSLRASRRSVMQPLQWIYSNDGWKTRVGGGTYDKWNPETSNDNKPFYVHAFNPTKELRVASESQYRPYYPKLRILEPGSNPTKPKLFECDPDPDCDKGVIVRDSMGKGKPMGRPCQCFSEFQNVPKYNTRKVYAGKCRVENPEDPWDYKNATQGTVAHHDLEGFDYRLPPQICLPPSSLPSSEYIGANGGA